MAQLAEVAYFSEKRLTYFTMTAGLELNHIMTDFMNLVLMGLLNAYFPGMKHVFVQV